VVLSTSQTAVAFAMIGLFIGRLLTSLSRAGKSAGPGGPHPRFRGSSLHIVAPRSGEKRK
jgi:hypothetical protein